MLDNDILDSHGELIRSLSRIANNHPNSLIQADIDRLENAKKVHAAYSPSTFTAPIIKSDTDESIPQHKNIGPNGY